MPRSNRLVVPLRFQLEDFEEMMRDGEIRDGCTVSGVGALSCGRRGRGEDAESLVVGQFE